MNRIGKTLVLLFVLLAQPGCTTMRLLDEHSPAAIQQNVERGDRVRIAASDGKVYELDVTKVEPQSLTGQADNGKRYQVHYSGIQALEVQEVSVLGTAGAGLATLYVAGIALVAILLHDLEIHFGICE